VAFETPATLRTFVLTETVADKGHPCTFIRLKRATSRGRVTYMIGDRHVTAVRIDLPDAFAKSQRLNFGIAAREMTEWRTKTNDRSVATRRRSNRAARAGVQVSQRCELERHHRPDTRLNTYRRASRRTRTSAAQNCVETV
jgi:hypothetical protein